MKKLFLSDKFFAVVTIIGFIGAIIYSLGCFLYWTDVLSSTYISAAIFMFLNGSFVLTLFLSYKSHCKNLMKAVIGALLMSAFATVCALTFPIVNTFTLDIVCCFVLFALTLILLINHFIINSDHHSRSSNIILNQLCALLITVDSVVWAIGWIPKLDSEISVLFQIITSITVVSIVSAIVCVESRLDYFRKKREDAGWSEENGYPKDYVHEYEKK